MSNIVKLLSDRQTKVLNLYRSKQLALEGILVEVYRISDLLQENSVDMYTDVVIPADAYQVDKLYMYPQLPDSIVQTSITSVSVDDDNDAILECYVSAKDHYPKHSYFYLDLFDASTKANHRIKYKVIEVVNSQVTGGVIDRMIRCTTYKDQSQNTIIYGVN